MTDERVRVVVAKPGLDGHDRGAKVIARAFRDAGFEVVYTGIFQTTESIVNAVIEEDAKVLGLSILSSAHLHYGEEICGLLKEQGADDVLVLMGGTIPDRDVPALKEFGVGAVFGPGTPTGDVIDLVRKWLAESSEPAH